MKSIHIKKNDLDKTLAEPKTAGKKLLEPLKSMSKAAGFAFNILEDDEKLSDAEIHNREADFWCCLEGRATFLLGGELVNQQYRKNADGSDNKDEVYAATMKEEQQVVLEEGDWLLIPKGEAHQHQGSSKDGFARLLIIKVPQQ